MSGGFLCTSQSYMYMNLVLMFLGVWSIAQHENADAVLMVGICVLTCTCMSYIFFIIYQQQMSLVMSEKTGLRGFRPGLTQTRLLTHRRWLEA